MAGDSSVMRVELVSPEKVLFSGEATMVRVRTLGGGDIAFLPGHAPFLGGLQEHAARIVLADGSDLVVAVHGGFVEVSHDKVSILSDVAELQSQIDVARAERAKAAAEQALQADPEDAVAKADLRRANARLSAAGATSSATSAH
jgi:F-type H+-transporting ATPase subunit epsilon